MSTINRTRPSGTPNPEVLADFDDKPKAHPSLLDRFDAATKRAKIEGGTAAIMSAAATVLFLGPFSLLVGAAAGAIGAAQGAAEGFRTGSKY
jgi:hypothetical protein